MSYLPFVSHSFLIWLITSHRVIVIKLKHSNKNIVRAQQIQAAIIILLYAPYVLSIQKYLESSEHILVFHTHQPLHIC